MEEVFMMSMAIQQTIYEARKAALTQLRDKSNLADLADDAIFQELLNRCQGVFEMSDREVADVLMVSRPTINRWSNGKNLPHRRVRKSVFSWISDTASKRLRILEKYEGANARQGLKAQAWEYVYPGVAV
jgi:transcriptional regulator with XRE-family HTH domain